MKRKKIKRRNQRKIIIIGLIIVVLFLAVSYSAFNTNINLTVKGNVYKVSNKCYSTKDNGDGTISITDYDKSCGSAVVIPSIIKGKTVTRIENGAFSDKNLTQIKLPDTLVYIGTESFVRNKLSSLEIPSSVTTIERYAFRHLNLHNLILHDGLKSIGLDAFQGNYLTEINIPKSVTYLGGGTFAANAVKGEAAFIYSRNEDGSTDYTKLDSYAGKDATGTTIPDTVVTLAPEAYYTVRYDEIDVPSRIKIIPGLCFNASWAKKVTLHEGLETIYGGAFGYTEFETINIPSTVTYMNEYTFTCSWGDCRNTSLKTININKKSGSLAGSPWGAVNATINWNDTN